MSLNQLLVQTHPTPATSDYHVVCDILDTNVLNTGALNMTGNAVITGDLTVTGDVSITQDLTVGQNLTVNSFKMATGAGVGKILTSDASGNGSWQASASSGQVLISPYVVDGSGSD